MTEVYIPRGSEAIDQVVYDEDAQTLTITFPSGSTWRYDGVPPEVFLGMQHAESAGKYFWRNIRNRFPGEET